MTSLPRPEPTPARPTKNHRKSTTSSFSSALGIARQLLIFFLGCAVTTTIFLNTHFLSTGSADLPRAVQLPQPTNNSTRNVNHLGVPPMLRIPQSQDEERSSRSLVNDGIGTMMIASELDGVKILVAIAAYDFSQIPHLEEVLDGYFDLCAAGSLVKVVVYCTVPWPVTLIDLLNTRFVCTNPSPRSGFSITIHLLSPVVRLHLVDYHRPLFYENLEQYDVFIYSEDDIRVSPKTVATYLSETKRVAEMVGPSKASDYNVGIARYEYNYPPDIIIDDNTRHATQNVTRVYWEHSWHPSIPTSVDQIPQTKGINGLSNYVHMKNHHQGMYLATRDLLRAWKLRKGCEFDEMKNRPGMRDKPSQPSEGTQRVWMSSQQLYGNRHCNVQQVIPMDKFGALTVLHLPNKNYRRLGRKGRMGGHSANNTSGEERIGSMAGPSSQLLTALQLHLEIRKHWPAQPQKPYKGIEMENHAQRLGAGAGLWTRRMEEYHAYVRRGGVLSEEDMVKTELLEAK
jgi:hypothetical protein